MKTFFTKTMPYIIIMLFYGFFATGLAENITLDKKVRIKAIGIPLADHYAGVVAYEKYKKQMKFADFQLLLLPGAYSGKYYTSNPPITIR